MSSAGRIPRPVRPTPRAPSLPEPAARRRAAAPLPAASPATAPPPPLPPTAPPPPQPSHPVPAFRPCPPPPAARSNPCAASAGSPPTPSARSRTGSARSRWACAGRLHGQAGHRHRQHLERPVALPRAPARARRGGEARRLAGRGYPVELPALSVGEVMVKPTTMLYRNFLAMETEELLRSHPVDGAVLLGGCDKSTPGLLMGAISMDLPAIFCPAGPMSNGQLARRPTGAGTHTKMYWDELRLGQHHRRRLGRARRPDDAQPRHLQHHGHRVDDDVDRRGAGLHAARRVVDPGDRCRPPADGRRLRRAHRARWCGRT